VNFTGFLSSPSGWIPDALHHSQNRRKNKPFPPTVDTNAHGFRKRIMVEEYQRAGINPTIKIKEAGE